MTQTQLPWVCSRIESSWRASSSSGGLVRRHADRDQRAGRVRGDVERRGCGRERDAAQLHGRVAARREPCAQLQRDGRRAVGGGRDAGDAPEPAPVAGGLVARPQQVEARHPVRHHRLLVAVDEQRQRGDPLIAGKARPDHEQRRARTDRQLRRERRVKAYVKVGQSAVERSRARMPYGETVITPPYVREHRSRWFDLLHADLLLGDLHQVVLTRRRA